VTAFFPFGAIVQLFSGFATSVPHFVHFAIFLHLKQSYFLNEYAVLKKLTKWLDTMKNYGKNQIVIQTFQQY
jgi:hypothetical protein